jgi:antitoxin component YwqK of YwqJK toxin-antitoxin module
MEKGSKNGKYKNYDREGHLILDGSFLNGKLEGDNTAYYPNGAVEHRFTYKDGKKSGVNLEYHSNGKTRVKETAALKGIEITQLTYDENELLVSEKKFRNEKPHGTWTFYFEGTKKIKRKESYENGKLSGTRYTYFSNGKLATEEIFKFNLLAGPFKTYYEDGTRESEGEYRSNRRHGLFTGYHANGKMREQGEYIADKKHKVWKEFDTQGNLKRTLIFKAGILVETREGK